MGIQARTKPNVLGVATTGFTGAAPQSVNGARILMAGIESNTLSAKVYALATTNTLTVTAKWQVSDDGSTWRDAKVANNAANVAIATGTGSAVTDTVQIAAPSSVYGSLYARLVCVSGVGVGGGAGVDEASVYYHYRVAG